MKVIPAGGAEINIGVTEAKPTISLIDYSRRETDDFGVTTVVRRAFAHQMSVRVKIGTDRVDAVQRQLAALRAKPAQWIADARFGALAFEGLYKDFSIDVAMPPVSYCTLTIEGLAEDAVFADPGTDVAPDGRSSTLRLVVPAVIDDSALVSINVPENDYPAWSSGVSYALGQRVILASTHRIYESAAEANSGNDPASSPLWIDTGPTNRWAMFDQALGSLTERNGPIVATIDPAGAVNAVALLDVTASTVRVQAAGYDRTLAPAATPGAVSFLDLPPTAGPITVTIAGAGIVSAGTLLAGNMLGLGVTEAGPTAAITDYSRKETDDFGEVTIVERAWAKRMTARAMIDTAAIDTAVGRVANVRATPCLWMADQSHEALSIYGFCKDFSIDVDHAVSMVALSIEGLSAAAKLAPLVTGDDITVPWDNISDPSGTKPEDNATVGAPGVSPVGDSDAGSVVAALMALGSVSDPDDIIAGAMALVDRTQDHQLALMLLGSATSPGDILAGVTALLDRVRSHSLAIYDAQLLGEERKARWERLTHLDGDEVATRVRNEITERIDGDTAIVERLNEIEVSASGDLSAAMAAISEEALVRASEDAAETSQRELAVSLLHARIGEEVIDVMAAISEEATTRATADAAETTARQLAISTLETHTGDQISAVTAAISAEATTRASAIAAETIEREQAISEVETALNGEIVIVMAAIASEATTRADGDAAETAQRALAISQIETSLSGQISTVMAAIGSEATTRATADEAEAAQRTALAASLGSGLTDVNAAILNEASVRATADAAEATAREAMAVSLSGEIGDLSAAVESEAAARATGDTAETTARQQAISLVNARIDDEVIDLQAAILSEASTRATADAAETTQREAAISVLQGTIDGNHDVAMASISAEATTRATAIAAETSAREQAISEVQTALDGEIVTVMAAIASEATTRADADTAEATARGALAASFESDIADVNAAILNEAAVRTSAIAGEATAREALAATLAGNVADVSAAVETEATARAAEDGALASLLSGVQTTVDGHTASVALLLESVDGLNARLVARVVDGDLIGGFELAAGGGEISAHFLVDDFAVINRSGDGWEFSEGRQVTTGGSIMSITGAPFGSTNQFLEWTGPIVSNLVDCTEANAIKFMKVDGSAYFGGGLSSGTLKNEGTSTTISPSAFIIVGSFASNGGPVNVNMSASYSYSYNCDSGTGAISGSGGGALALEWSSDGATWTSLTSIGVNENERLVIVDGEPGVPDYVTWSMAAAGTFTWTPGALSGVYIRLRWTSFSLPTMHGTGSLAAAEISQRTSIIAVEQP